MKNILFILVLFGINLSIGQIGPVPFFLNQSNGPIATSITTPVGTQSGEIFRFRPGNVRQLDSGSSFNFTNSRWFSLGRVNTGSQNVYGLRFQLPNKTLTMGYQDLSDANPRIQWVGTGADLGDLEFRVADNFFATTSTLVARMTNEGNTFFGSPTVSTSNLPKVGIQNTGRLGVQIVSGGVGSTPVTSSTGLTIRQSSGSVSNNGLTISASGGSSSSTGISISASAPNVANGIVMRTSAIRATGVSASASGPATATDVIGIRGRTFASGFLTFQAGIYGQASPGLNSYAGYFDGNVFTTGSYLPSDKKLKNNISEELNALDKIALLRPVTYNYKEMSEINLSKGKQHGFISQEFAEIFPELTRDVTKPVFDEEGNITSNFTLKAINYTGLISVLTSAVNELNEEVQSLKEEIADMKDDRSSDDNENGSLETSLKAELEQNVPNPFTDRTSISYRLQEGVQNVSLMVFDMNGKIVREFKLSNNSGEISINASQIGKGMFIYSLVQNGQELISKKMIIK